MGLIALAGLLAVIVFVGGVSTWYRYVRGKPAPSLFHSIGLSLLIAVPIWVAFNYGNIKRQREMNAVARDCGWRVYKTISSIEGVYIEPLHNNSPYSIARGFYLPIYSAVQYPDGGEGVTELKRTSANAVETSSKVSERTFRYGFRTTEARVGHDIMRLKHTVLDFDSGDILAENVSYAFDDTHQLDLKDLLLVFVAYHPTGCGWMGAVEEEARFRAVLQPRSGLSR
jgi:hypothetical protein